MPKNDKDNEIYLERIYHAPVKLVWDVWMEAEHVTKWWGPRGFSITNTSKEVKAGGEWLRNVIAVSAVKDGYQRSFPEV
jgi:uncharacterized protein YndB with AHSA1/START domain